MNYRVCILYTFKKCSFFFQFVADFSCYIYAVSSSGVVAISKMTRILIIVLLSFMGILVHGRFIRLGELVLGAREIFTILVLRIKQHTQSFLGIEAYPRGDAGAAAYTSVKTCLRESHLADRSSAPRGSGT